MTFSEAYQEHVSLILSGFLESQRIDDALGPTFGVEFERFRTRQGWSQEQAAKLFGVKLETIEQWEAGRSLPRSPLTTVICLFHLRGEGKE